MVKTGKGRPSKWTEEKDRFAVELLTMGLSSTDIAKVMNSRWTDDKYTSESVRQYLTIAKGHYFTKRLPKRRREEIMASYLTDGKIEAHPSKDLASRLKRVMMLRGLPLLPEKDFTDEDLRVSLYKPDGIVWFSENVLGFQLYDYQKEMMIAIKNNPVSAFITGRQTGKSTMLAIVALYYALTEVCSIAIASRSLDQAQLLYLVIKQFILPKRQLAESVLALSKEGIEFRNGSSIRFFSGLTPEGILGMAQCHLIIDEFTFVGNRFFELANPVRAVGDKKLICAGTAGYVDRSLWSWQLWFQNPDVAKKEYLTSANPRISQRFLDEQRRIFDSDTYGALYECKWIDQADKWFSWKLMHSATEDYSADAIMPERGDTYNVGLDPSYSGTGDYACMSVLKRSKVKKGDQEFPAYRLVYHRRFKPETLEELLAEVNFVYQNYGKVISSFVVDGSDRRLIEALSNMNVYAIPYDFSGEGRNNLMKNLKMILEQGRIAIPNNMDLIREFCGLKYKISGFGKLIITPSTHDDQVVAIGMGTIPDEMSFLDSLPETSIIGRKLPYTTFKRRDEGFSLSGVLRNWKPGFRRI